jgi:hypothetical protein
MSKKRSNQLDFFDLMSGISFTLWLIISSLIIIIIKVIAFGYDDVTIYQSGYKEKSGNRFFKTYFNKGHMGEFKLYRKLTQIVRKADIFTNMYILGKNTTHTELDLVVLSDRGILLYEVKNYRGSIYGSKSEVYCTQVLSYFIKNKFYNPIRQNYLHHKSLANYLNVNESEIVPIISFTNRSKLRRIDADHRHYVLQTKYTIAFTKKILKDGPILFDQLALNQMRHVLKEASLKGLNIKDAHIQEVKQLVNK